MAKTYTLSQFFNVIGASLLLVASVVACAGLPSVGPTSWKEEALLHDGTILLVERSVARGGRHELGQEPPIKEQTLSFNAPQSGKVVTWRDEFSEDIGSANFLPLLVDVYHSVPYLVALPMGCLSYNKWGRPNPPYVIFRLKNDSWEQIALEDLPAEIVTPNLILSVPDAEGQKAGETVFSVEMVKTINEKNKKIERRVLVREKIVNAGGKKCSPMVGNGKGDWEGIGSFKSQPSLGACLTFCANHKFDPVHCPCHQYFGEK